MPECGAEPEAGLWWSTARWMPPTDGSGANGAEEVLGPDLGRWRALRASHPARAARFLSTREAVHALVTEHGLFPWRGFAPSTPGRKPAFAAGGADFSVSRSGGILLVAVAERGRVGVDVETDEAVFGRGPLVRRMCTPAELAIAGSLTPTARAVWLARLWSVKEAIVKRDGVGLARDLRTLDCSGMLEPDPPGPAGVAAAIAHDDTVRELRPAAAPETARSGTAASGRETAA